MQWEILTMLDYKELTINRFTGDVQGIPSIPQLLAIINQKMGHLTPEKKVILKNGLRTMLEATEIAIFVANVEASLQDRQFIFYQTVNSNLLATLNSQKQNIENLIKRVNDIQIGEQSSYFSWLWSSTSNTAQSYKPDSTITVSINPQSPLVTIPAELMATIIKNNDYKQTSDPNKAANLLFKECFIAQQHHLKDLHRIGQIRINLQSPVSAHNYIYTNFPDFRAICAIAKDIIPGNQYRSDLRAPVTPEQQQAHQLLIHARQAIQTALYISNKKSDINLGYLLPNYVKSYLDATLNVLLQYDKELSTLCKDPRYGATMQDTYQDEQWSTITTWAIRAAVTGAVVGVAYRISPELSELANIKDNLSKGFDSISNWWSGTSKPANTDQKQEPVQGPQQASWYDYLTKNAQTIGTTGKQVSFAAQALGQYGATTGNKDLQKYAQYAQTAGSIAGGLSDNYDDVASAIGSTGKQIARIGQAAAQYGAATGNSQLQKYAQYGQTGGLIAGGLTGNYADVAQSLGAGSSLVGGQAGAVGSALGSTIGAVGAAAQAKNVYDQQGGLMAAKAGLDAYQAGQDAYNKILHAYNVVQTSDKSSDNVNIKILTPQEIYNALIAIIQQTVSTGGNLIQQLSGFIDYLFSKQMATPPTISSALKQLPPELVQNPQVAQPVSQIIQVLDQISAPNPQAQPAQAA